MRIADRYWICIYGKYARCRNHGKWILNILYRIRKRKVALTRRSPVVTDLDQLDEGDHFLIHVLNETLCYEVDKISVVKPEETSALAVEEGEDLVTLLTCTPYGVNSWYSFSVLTLQTLSRSPVPEIIERAAFIAVSME